ncbi:MAG: TetR/AcrR family transcriptional regulator [Deltaproteobacteria bacterium]|nr:MAG: TetR/AcrR family transcriptional regulator [Deltaproteobacteria bacterium]
MSAGAVVPEARPREAVPRKKRDLMRSASWLFRKHGLKRVSVEEICAQAGASKATFYKYFPNKIELVKYILVEMSEAAHAKVAAIEALDAPFSVKARMMMDHRLESTRKTSTAFIEDFYHADDELAAFIDEMMADNQRRFLDVVVSAQKRGDMRPEVKPEFILALLVKMNELAADDGLRAHYPDYVALTQEIVDFFFLGLLVEKRPTAKPEEQG